MYSIEYYKTKRNKPIIWEPLKSGNPQLDGIRKKNYFKEQDLVDKCWNIKSLTIDLEDIRNIIHDRNIKHLYSLYARTYVQDLTNVDAITILNNNYPNSLFIYEIINCEWLINRDEELSSTTVLKNAKELYDLIIACRETTDQVKQAKIKERMKLLKYYLDTATNKYPNKEKSKKRALKLGTKFIAKKSKNELLNR